MRSRTAGKSISRAEVINVSPNGLWLLAAGREYFLPYDEFPWFKNATVGHIFDVRLEHGCHLHWPQLEYIQAAPTRSPILNLVTFDPRFLTIPTG